MDVARVVAAGSIALAGLTGGWLPLRFLLTGDGSIFGTVLALLGVVLGVVLVVVSGLLYRSSIPTRGVVRIGGWHFLGIAVLALILGLVELYVPGALPLFAAADIILVSAFAHVLIGYNDVRQIRAEELADRTQRLDVLSQVLRHNLRTEAQVLLGHADRIQRSDDLAAARAGAERVEASAESLTALNEKVGEVYWAMEFDAADAAPTSVEPALEAVADEYRDRADVTVDCACPTGTRVLAGDRLDRAVGYLVADALVDNDADPEVTLAAEAVNDGVEVSVTSPGGRITDEERELLEGDADITQLNHSRTIDLWVAQWIADAYGGEFHIAEDAPGSRVALRLPRADA
ncbi:hypothetical protein N0B31_11225 [Salinirubellus salinus]|uniref:Histidine kinase n=1 Tax=Salinirubellus salinus TaxID=1364945 RepID=A0A9E7QZA9_9EURY|nr:hypothetical protein [Salinirubellus salinus]UWM52722.1 hypothetical protein N0B31_11225 [Salinirubellus salinus]